MRHARVSIASLMVVVLFAATVIASLSHPSVWWASSLYTLALGLLCWGTVVAVRSGRRRPFWTGFAVFGWLHLVVNFGLFGLTPGLKPFPPPPPTLYEELMRGLGRWMLSWPPSTQPIIPSPPTPPPSTPFTIVTPIDQTPFYQTGYLLLTLFIAWFGGFLARLEGRARRPSSPCVSRPGPLEGAPVDVDGAR